MSSEFLKLFLNSPGGQEAVQSQSPTSSSLRSLSVGRIKAIPIPVPPLAEQRGIVAGSDVLHAEADALKRLPAGTPGLDAQLPATMGEAFEREL